MTRIVNKIYLLIFFSIIALVQAQGLKVEAPYLSGFHPLDAEANEYSVLRSSHPVLMKLDSKMFTDTSKIDFEKRQLSFRRTDPLGYTLWEYFYPELSDYLSERRNFSVARNWKSSRTEAMKKESKKSKHDVSKLEWELPVQYPSWAQRILGNEPPKLSIDGSLKLIIGFERSSNQVSKGSSKDTRNDFVLDEDYEFSISGSVGRLISVNIRTSKQSGFEFSDNLKNFKIEYKESYAGELEDEIIQEVVAGYTGFDMPGQSLSGNIESKKGLFGIKIKAKLGPLMLTSIAATEQAESSSKTFTQGSSGSGSTGGSIKNYQKNRFYYLDTTYRTAYIKRYGKGGNPDSITAPKVDSLEVWVRSSIYNGTNNGLQKDSIYLTESDTTMMDVGSIMKTQWYKFSKLRENVHYKLDKENGYINFLDSVDIRDEDQIAIYLRAGTDKLKKGQYLQAGNGDMIRVFWTLKPEGVIETPKVNPSRYYLMWRNVYSLPADLLNYTVSIKKKNEGGNPVDKNSVGSLYSWILGIADKTGKALTTYSDIFRAEDRALVIPPWSNTSPDADLPFMNPALGADVDTMIYKVDESDWGSSYTTQFTIDGTGESKKTTYDVDYGIIEGTDKVWANGTVLERDKDYVVNYDMGTLELLSLRAKAASSIKMDYQTQSMFVPDKKVFLGVNGQVQLPFISDKSYIGGTILYQNVKVNEDIPRLGQEPYSKFLFDMNTNIELEPEWMTTLVNRLPLVETTAESKVRLNVEVAHSKMDPNPDGKAYLDDFEDNKVSDNVGSSGEDWHQASPPDSILAHYYDNPPAWDFYWFTPGEWDNINRIPKTELYVYDKNVTASAKDGYVSAVRFHCTPAPLDGTIKQRYKKAWAGVMTPIPTSFANKSKMQYLDLYVRDSTLGKSGKLLIQLGQMREDISLNGGFPNGSSDMEDTTINSTEYREERDRGLDTLFDKDEIFIIPGSVANTWDTLKYGDTTLEKFSEDPSKDNGKQYDEDNRGNFRFKCKTEKSEYLETEDLNNNGTVETSTMENYFQFKIDLKDTSAFYYDRDAKIEKKYGWRKLHIPLHRAFPGSDTILDTSGSPSWTRITMVRMIWTGFDETYLTKESKLTIAEMGFVGNQWEVSAVPTDTIKDSAKKANQIYPVMEALSIGNKDDSTYTSPFKVDIDDVTNEVDREQSLRLSFRRLQRSKEITVSKNTSYQDLNLTSYKTLNMDLYGKRADGEVDNGEALYGGHVKFVFRFGTDSTTYYEYRREIYSGWEKNKIRIDLQKLAKAKNEYMINHPDTTINDSGEFIIKAPKGRQPNLADIEWMALGVIRDSVIGADTVSGEIWINEMILTGIDKISGWAAKGELKLGFADLLQISSNMDYTNGNYRKMNDYDKTPKNSSVTISAGAELSLDKFIPGDLGINLPASVTMSSTVNRSQLKNNDVKLSDDGNADNLTDMAGDALRMMIGQRKSDESYRKDSERYGRQTGRTTVTTSYSKSSESETWVGDLIADRISTNFTYTNSIDDSAQGRMPASDSIYKLFTESNSYSGSIKYDLTPHDEVKYKPIENDTGFKWAPRLKNYELALLPSKFSFTLIDVGLTKTETEDTKKKYKYRNRTFDARHMFEMAYSPINPLLKFDYSLSINRDLDTVVFGEYDHNDLVSHVFKLNQNSGWDKYYILYGEEARTQSAGVSVDPQFFDWWTNTADYKSTYKSTLSKYGTDTTDYFNSNLDLTFDFESRIDFQDLISVFTNPHKNMKTRRDSSVVNFESGFKKLGFRSISFNYSAKTTLINNYISTSLMSRYDDFSFFDYMIYQLGAKGRKPWDVITGDMGDDKFGGMRSRQAFDRKDLYKNDKRTVDRDYKFSTGLDLKVPFEISFNPISFGWSKKIDVTTDTTYWDTAIVFPEISVSSKTPVLMKLNLVSDNFRNFDLSSSFAYSRDSSITSSDPRTSRRIDLSPLISVNGTIKKWPIVLTYSNKYSKEENSFTLTRNETYTFGNELSIRYDIEKSGRLNELKILYWTIPVKGKTSIGLTASTNKTERTDYDKSKDDDEGDKKETLKLLLNPFLTYIFTDHVTGTLRWNASYERENEEIDKKNEFLIEIEIKFK